MPLRLDSIFPVVLCGGQSRRFGRDKLREPIASAPTGNPVWLIDRPIAVLRSVFGPRVTLIGNCDQSVASRADAVIKDLHPGIGPLGGIISALSAAQVAGYRAIFVLAGDLPMVTYDVVQGIAQVRLEHPDALAIIGQSGRPEPCIAAYDIRALEVLRHSVDQGPKSPPLIDCVQRLSPILCPIPSSVAANINTREDLAALNGRPD